MATRESISFLRLMYPWWFARIVYQVGRPAMFDGKRFLPETGTPIWKIERSRTRLAVWLPDPLTVATWMLKSLTTALAAGADWSASVATSEEAMCARSSVPDTDAPAPSRQT